MFFRDMLDETGDEVHGRKYFCDKGIVFMAIVMKDNVFAIIVIDARGSNNRAAKISANVFENVFWIAKIWFGVNIEAIFTFFVDIGFPLFKGITDFFVK